ncbi:modulator of macroautophagy TMEM150B isoform X2 [Manis pentadactyla]|uniref:modulator of macroautophagy TMEM150B isoform X2 n=1 Tax=Manis pentadactyla TaxID=143292 RepID=UPI00255CB8E1|nr:modulator of macroautophagy TMEM150B isoform X2 [Manis pentadactyla]
MVVWPSRPPCPPRLPPGEFRPGRQILARIQSGRLYGVRQRPGGCRRTETAPRRGAGLGLGPPCPPRTRLGLGEPEGTEGAPQNRHVGLPVPAARLPGPLGSLRRLDRFCDCGGQRGCEPHRRLPLYQSCIFSQLLNMGAAMAAWICILRYHQLRDWGVGKWPNQLILWTGLLCALGTSVVGNFQQKNQLPTHLTGAFFAFFVGNLYFWLQLLLFWRMRSLPQPGAPWIGPLRLGLCGLCTILMVAMVVLHTWPLRSASAACEWAVAMLLFTLFGLFAVDFSSLDGCALCLQPGPSLSVPPASPVTLQVRL